jgi:hypothetical protein
MATIFKVGDRVDWNIALLAQHRIEAVADVRSFPGSRRCPQYGRLALQASLAQRQLEYHWLPALGGRRRPVPDLPHIAWRHVGFRITPTAPARIVEGRLTCVAAENDVPLH